MFTYSRRQRVWAGEGTAGERGTSARSITLRPHTLVAEGLIHRWGARHVSPPYYLKASYASSLSPHITLRPDTLVA
jgi:hypothetical protein